MARSAVQQTTTTVAKNIYKTSFIIEIGMNIKNESAILLQHNIYTCTCSLYFEVSKSIWRNPLILFMYYFFKM